jgi:CheY-like chemotaxis protein
MSIRVVVADDQEIVRTGLAMILNALPDIEVVGAAAEGIRAVELARRLRPDVCLFDIRMPGVDGIEATRRVAGPGVDTRSPSSSSPPSTWTRTSTPRCVPVPAVSSSRTRVRSSLSRRSRPWRTGTR